MTIRLKNSPNGKKKKKRLATEKRCLGGRNKGHEARVRMVNSGNRHQIWMEKKLNGRRVGAGLLLALALFCLSIRAREGYGPGKAGQRSLPVTLVFFFFFLQWDLQFLRSWKEQQNSYFASRQWCVRDSPGRYTSTQQRRCVKAHMHLLRHLSVTF